MHSTPSQAQTVGSECSGRVCNSVSSHIKEHKSWETTASGPDRRSIAPNVAFSSSSSASSLVTRKAIESATRSNPIEHSYHCGTIQYFVRVIQRMTLLPPNLKFVYKNATSMCPHGRTVVGLCAVSWIFLRALVTAHLFNARMRAGFALLNLRLTACYRRCASVLPTIKCCYEHVLHSLDGDSLTGYTYSFGRFLFPILIGHSQL